jgi:hypothetical protein
MMPSYKALTILAIVHQEELSDRRSESCNYSPIAKLANTYYNRLRTTKSTRTSRATLFFSIDSSARAQGEHGCVHSQQ